MSKHLPPVPPDNVSPKGPAGGRKTDPNPATRAQPVQERNLKEQGQQGNIAQNTHNQGYQQDR